MTLEEIKPGETCKVVGFERKGPLRRRIMDMGIIKGTIIHVVRVAPLGDPMEVKARGYELSLRKEEASNVLVELE